MADWAAARDALTKLVWYAERASDLASLGDFGAERATILAALDAGERAEAIWGEPVEDAPTDDAPANTITPLFQPNMGTLLARAQLDGRTFSSHETLSLPAVTFTVSQG